jgi:hypothetical protein
VGKTTDDPRKHKPTEAERDECTSLRPLDPEKALAALLQVDPDSEPAQGEPRETS